MTSECTPTFIDPEVLFNQFMDMKKDHINWNMKRCAKELQTSYNHLARIVYLKQRKGTQAPHSPLPIPYYLSDYHKLKEVTVSCTFAPIEHQMIQHYLDLHLYTFKNDVLKNAIYEFFDHEQPYLTLVKELNLCPAGKI